MTGRILSGHYAVPDPDQPSRLTFWEVDENGQVRDWPQGVRWRPLPPRGLTREQNHDWYAPGGPYRTWRAQVAEAIAADPVAAAVRFRTERPEPAPPALPHRRRAAARKPKQPDESRAETKALADTQALIVAALRAGRTPFRAISRTLGIPLATAHRRAARGRHLAQLAGTDVPDLLRRSMVDQLGAALTALGGGALDEPSRETVRAVAAALLPGDDQAQVSEVRDDQ